MLLVAGDAVDPVYKFLKEWLWRRPYRHVTNEKPKNVHFGSHLVHLLSTALFFIYDYSQLKR
jgi:hypothetical protein